MAFMFMPNGVRPDYWTPAGDGEDYEFTPHLKPLESLKSDFLLLENLWNKNTVGRNGHWPKVPALLSGGYRGAHHRRRSGFRRHLRRPAGRAATSAPSTPLPTFELGIDAPRTGIDTAGGGFPRALGSFHLLARSAHAGAQGDHPATGLRPPVPQQPRAGGIRASIRSIPSLLASLQRDETSVLDLVMDEAKSLRRQGSAGDQARLDEYFESVRSVEQRLEASHAPAEALDQSGQVSARPSRARASPRRMPSMSALMLDILMLAFWTDTTRIAHVHVRRRAELAGLLLAARREGQLPRHLAPSQRTGQREQYEKIINWNMEQVAYFLNRMRKPG